MDILEGILKTNTFKIVIDFVVTLGNLKLADTSDVGFGSFSHQIYSYWSEELKKTRYNNIRSKEDPLNKK